MSINRGRAKTKDSQLAYYVNQLENLDKRFYEPLYNVRWGRDIKLRSGITMSDETTSFIRNAIAGAGSLSNSDNIPFIGAETNAIEGVSVNGQKTTLQLRLAAREISYTSVELDRSQKTGQSIDVQKMDAFNILYQLGVDRMVYVGASSVGTTGLVNTPGITAGSVETGVGGGTQWVGKTADEIVADVNNLIVSTWEASAFEVCPQKIILPPSQFAYISSQKVSSAGNVSILKYIQDNSITLQETEKALEIVSSKWMTGQGANGSDRMMAYTNEERFVRYPMVPVRRETAYYQGIRFIAPYLWALGEMEFVYPETLQYADGI